MSLACFKSIAVRLFFSILFFWDSVKLVFSLAEPIPLPPCTSNEPVSSSRFSLLSFIACIYYLLKNTIANYASIHAFFSEKHNVATCHYSDELCPIPNHGGTRDAELTLLHDPCLHGKVVNERSKTKTILGKVDTSGRKCFELNVPYLMLIL